MLKENNNKIKIDQLITFKKGFASMKAITISTILISFIFCIIIYINSEKKVSQIYEAAVNSLTEKQWVIKDDGTAISLSRENITESSKIAEYEHHIKMVYNSFYVFDPYINFDSKLNKGLNLVSLNVGKKIIDLHDNNDLANLIKGQGMHLYVEIDSVIMDINNKVATGIAFAKQTIIKKKGKGVRNLYVDFEISPVNTRTKENPHALVVTKWNISNNEKINVVNSQ